MADDAGTDIVVTGRKPARRQNIADFRLTLDGEDLTATVRPRLVSLRLTEKRGGEADELELVLDDSDGKLEIPKKDVLIRLELGWKQGADVTVGLVDKGRFTVDEASWESPPDQVTVKARSADLTASYRVRRERSHRDTTLGAVASKVAAANGLTAKVAPELASIAVPVLVQDQKSDMALVRQLGRQHDAVATVKDRTLILAPIGAGKTAAGADIPAASLRRDQCDRAAWRTVERDSYAKVEARWHDQGAARRQTATAPVRRASEQDGAADGKVRRLSRTYHTETDAKAAASAEAGRIARKAAELDLDVALGRPDLYPERKLTLTGFKAPIDAVSWLISEVTTMLDGQGGLTTSLKLETA